MGNHNETAVYNFLYPQLRTKMASNWNPGNFANRPQEEVENLASKGGQHSHQGGFASMDPSKQKNIASKGGQMSGGNQQQQQDEQGTEQIGQRRSSKYHYVLMNWTIRRSKYHWLSGIFA